MRKHHQHIFCILFLIFVSILISSAITRSAVVVDNFENAKSPAPWIFSNGPEFPGAAGSLSRGTGHTGYGAHLAFNMSLGGNYVQATKTLAAPTPAGALQFWVKCPGGVRIQVRINDGTGQTLQYTLNRPMEAVAAGQWYQLFLPFDPTAEHWGGSVNDGVFHGGVTGISILAQPGLTKVGAIDFDDVTLLGARSTLVDPAGPVAAVPDDADFSDTTGVEITHDDATAAGLDLVRQLGFHRIRTEMFWADIETRAGVYNFAWYDQLVADLKARGLAPHFILCYGNAVYTGTDWFQPPRTPGAILGFANFARAAAARYLAQGVHFEIWNEPDVAGFWNPPNAAAYSALCQSAAAQLHAVDPVALVASGGLGGVDLAFLGGMVTNRGLDNVNAVSVHPYRQEIPEGFTNDLAALRSSLTAAFPAHFYDVWSTEEGYSSAWYGDGTLAANRATQAKLGVRQILTGLGLNLPVQIVFDLRDVGTNAGDPEQNFGIVTASYQPKPLTAAVQTLLNACKGYSFMGPMAAPKSSMHIFKFQNTGETLLALWSESVTGKTPTISFPQPPLKVLDYLGNPLAVTPDGKGHYAVPVGDAPVYATFARTP